MSETPTRADDAPWPDNVANLLRTALNLSAELNATLEDLRHMLLDPPPR